MFYCSSHTGVALREITAQPGDRIYVSVWQIVEPFNLIRMPPDRAKVVNQNIQAFDLIAAFLNHRFTEKIDQAFSNRYKITAAISHCYAHGAPDRYATNNLPMGGIQYDSVVLPGQGANFAVHANVAAERMKLTHVMEVEVAGSLIEKRIAIRMHGSVTNIETDGKLLWGPRPWGFPLIEEFRDI